MKRIFFLTILITALLMSGCSSDAPAASVEEIAAADEQSVPAEGSSADATTPKTLENYLSTDYENAISPYIQLSLGTLKLAETDQLISVEQAGHLLLLWQASKSLESNPNKAPQEIAAVQAQIVATMTAEQLGAIANMQLTNEDLAAFYESMGMSMPNPDDESEGQRGGGMGGGSSELTQEERESMRATRQASSSGDEGGGAGRERKTILTDTVVNYLLEIIANGE
ncbi:MAG: hypothetical protein ABFS03_10105 [Chloroflexota bacterium]